MSNYKTIAIKEDILSRNNEQAKEIKAELNRRKIFYLNVMASPGAGKTTLLVELINRLKGSYRIGVIEADIDSETDAKTVADKTGVRTIQMHTCGACHVTCQMSYEALTALGLDDLDFVILENVGNLVCPAEFDTGATVNLVLLSSPEGDDKPLKYPLMFSVADVVALTKLDVKDVFGFSVERAVANITKRNANAPVFPLSVTQGFGVDELEQYIVGLADSVVK